jgi:endonuclease/exonuclease/phosphatase family metal-dependent hydrolase
MNNNISSSLIRVMTYNIRFDNPHDGDNRWELRRERLSSLIRFHQPDLLGVQEALIDQIYFLNAFLPEYDWYGVGREDGADKGEFSPVFYRKSRFTLLTKVLSGFLLLQISQARAGMPIFSGYVAG